VIVAFQVRGNAARLSPHAKVGVIIPGVESEPQAHVYSPRLVHPEQAAVFAKQIIAVSADAELRRVALRSTGPGCARYVTQSGQWGEGLRRASAFRHRGGHHLAAAQRG